MKRGVIYLTMGLCMSAMTYIAVPQSNSKQEPKISKEGARDIGITFLRKVKLYPSKDDTVSYFYMDMSPQAHYPWWNVQYGGKASVTVCSETGKVLQYTNLTHFYEHTKLKKHEGLKVLWNEAQSIDVGKQLLTQLGMPKGLVLGRTFYRKTGETGPTAEIAMTVSKGGYTVKNAGWFVVIFDLHDGTIYKYFENDKPVIESVTKKVDYKELLAEAKQTYEKYKNPLIVTDGLRKFTKARLELQRSDLTRPIQGPSKHVKGIAKYRLAWIFDFGGDYVAMDAETGKAMAVGYKPRPWKPRKPMSPVRK